MEIKKTTTSYTFPLGVQAWFPYSASWCGSVALSQVRKEVFLAASSGGAGGGLGALSFFFLKLQSSGSIQSRNGRLFPNVLLRKTKQIGVCQGPRGSRGAAYLCVSNSRAGYHARACLQRTHGSQVCSGTSPHGRCQARLRMRHSLGRTDSSPALSIRKHTTRRRKALQRISHQGIAE